MPSYYSLDFLCHILSPLSGRQRQSQDPPQHACEQAPRQMALCQQQPVVAGMLYQPAAKAHLAEFPSTPDVCRLPGRPHPPNNTCFWKVRTGRFRRCGIMRLRGRIPGGFWKGAGAPGMPCRRQCPVSRIQLATRRRPHAGWRLADRWRHGLFLMTDDRFSSNERLCP